MRKMMCSILAAMTIAIIASAGTVHAQPLPNLGGSYRCEADPSPCPGQTFSVTQSGANLTIKDDKGVAGNGTITSVISLSVGPPWNMLGVILPDNRGIQWSNGTLWRKP